MARRAKEHPLCLASQERGACISQVRPSSALPAFGRRALAGRSDEDESVQSLRSDTLTLKTPNGGGCEM